MKSKESIPRRSTCVIGEECVGILLSVQCESIVIRGGTAAIPKLTTDMKTIAIHPATRKLLADVNSANPYK